MSWLHQHYFFFVPSSVHCSHSCSIIIPVSHIDMSFQRRAIIQNHNLELIGTSPLTLHSVKFWRKCKLLLAVTVTAYHWNRDWCVHVPVQYRVMYGLWILSEDRILGGSAVIERLFRRWLQALREQRNPSMSFKKLVIDNLNIARKRILMRSVIEPVSSFLYWTLHSFTVIVYGIWVHSHVNS